jgi:predicted dehydrogenase
VATHDLTALVIGCGSIGRRHARNLAALGVGEILLFDVDPERSAEAANESDGCAVGDLEQSFAGGRGVAFVCSPPTLHFGHVSEALEAGWDIFVEKPVAPTAAEAEALASLAEAQNAITLVGFNLRFEPGLIDVERLLRSGDLGRPLAARGIVGQFLPDWHPWEDYRIGYSARRNLGGGVLLDSSHEIDIALWLFGEPKRVWSQGGKVSSLEIDTEDIAQISLEFPVGPLVQLQLDYLQRSPRRELEIACENGTIRWRYDERRLDVFADGSWTTTRLRDDHNLTYLDEMEHLLQAVEARTPTRCDLREGARSLRVVEAAKKSADST